MNKRFSPPAPSSDYLTYTVGSSVSLVAKYEPSFSKTTCLKTPSLHRTWTNPVKVSSPGTNRRAAWPIWTNERPGWWLPASGLWDQQGQLAPLPGTATGPPPPPPPPGCKVRRGETIDGQDLILLTVCSPAERDLMWQFRKINNYNIPLTSVLWWF